VRVGTRYAVLGLLQERPSYGYEVLVRFRRAFDAAQWGVSAQGLYAALDRLERDGLIEPVAGHERGSRRRQPKTPYRVTPTGSAELRRFLETPMSAEPSRAELLVRLQCVAEDDTGALLQMLDDHEQACLDELGRMTEEATAPDPAGEALVDRLALEERRLGVQARLLWIDYARRELRAAAGEGRRPRRATAAS
jgi:DNA-binding PadR family transcriptional regulator